MSKRVVFITGTDTGVGKTVLTGLLLAHTQAAKSGSVAALKPFCSGGREDAEIFFELQGGKLPLDRINPFFFNDPVSPWTAGRLEGRRIGLSEAMDAIQGVNADLRLIEGAGGLLAPLGDGFTALDLIRELQAEVLVAAANRLGVISHTLLTAGMLRQAGMESVKIALINGFSEDVSVQHNAEDLAILSTEPVVLIPGIEGDMNSERLRQAARRLGAELDRLLAPIRG